MAVLVPTVGTISDSHYLVLQGHQRICHQSQGPGSGCAGSSKGLVIKGSRAKYLKASVQQIRQPGGLCPTDLGGGCGACAGCVEEEVGRLSQLVTDCVAGHVLGGP